MTRKLKLDPEALAVASFEIQESGRDGGTVQGHGVECANTDLRSCPFTIRTCASWEFSCRAEDQA